MASSISAVDGLADWPPDTSLRAPRERSIRLTPSPAQTATTAQLTGSSGASSWPPRRLRLAYPALLFDLVAQVRHPDLAGPADLDGRLYGLAHVVGVDVAVVQAVAAHDDDGAPAALPHGAEGGHRLVRRLQEKHHLEAQFGGAPVPRGTMAGQGGLPSGPGVVGRLRPGRPPAGRPGRRRGCRHRTSVQDVQETVEHKQQPGPAGVHHAGGTQRRQLCGGPVQGPGRRLAGALEHVDQTGGTPPSAARPAPTEAARATVRMVPSTGLLTAA